MDIAVSNARFSTLNGQEENPLAFSPLALYFRIRHKDKIRQDLILSSSPAG
jgi:hypothetical protein